VKEGQERPDKYIEIEQLLELFIKVQLLTRKREAILGKNGLCFGSGMWELLYL
jgi:hypothetical protein